MWVNGWTLLPVCSGYEGLAFIERSRRRHLHIEAAVARTAVDRIARRALPDR